MTKSALHENWSTDHLIKEIRIKPFQMQKAHSLSKVSSDSNNDAKIGETNKTR